MSSQVIHRQVQVYTEVTAYQKRKRDGDRGRGQGQSRSGGQGRVMEYEDETKNVSYFVFQRKQNHHFHSCGLHYNH